MSRPYRNLPLDFRGRSRILKLFILAVLLFISLSFAAGLYVDKLWFESLGFESVFWYGIKARGLFFLVLLAATTAALWLGLRMIIAVAGTAKRLLVEIGGGLVEPPSLDTVQRIAHWFSIVFAPIVAAILSSQWLVFARYLNQPVANGVVDPIFGRSLNFYLFTLPMIEVAYAWFMLISIVIVIAAVLMYGIGVTVRLRGLS